MGWMEITQESVHSRHRRHHLTTVHVCSLSWY